MSNSLSWCDNGVLEKYDATEAVVSILGCSERVGSGGGLVPNISDWHFKSAGRGPL